MCEGLRECRILESLCKRTGRTRLRPSDKGGEMSTETLDKLYLELSLISKAKTAREIELEAKLARAVAALNSVNNWTTCSECKITVCEVLKELETNK